MEVLGVCQDCVSWAVFITTSGDYSPDWDFMPLAQKNVPREYTRGEADLGLVFPALSLFPILACFPKIWKNNSLD